MHTYPGTMLGGENTEMSEAWSPLHSGQPHGHRQDTDEAVKELLVTDT